MLRLAIFLTAISAAIAPAIAHADRDILEWSPSVLDAGEVRVGPGVAGVGILDRAELDTHPFLYSAFAAGGAAYDVSGKLEVLRTPRVAASIGIGVTDVSFGAGSPFAATADAVDVRVIPVETWAAVKPTDGLRLTAGLVYADIAASGHTSMAIGRFAGGDGRFAGSNVELYGSAQVAVAPHLTAIAGVRAVAWQGDAIDATVATARGPMSGSVDDPIAAPNAWAASAALHVEERSFNLEVGVEYGNYHVPVVDLVAPQRGFLPVVDLYWRL